MEGDIKWGMRMVGAGIQDTSLILKIRPFLDIFRWFKGGISLKKRF